MGLLGEKLLEKIPPKQREVWFVSDDEIKLNPDNRVDKKRRPVLIVSAPSLLANKDFPLLNVVPLSTQGVEDKLCYPIARAYEETAAGFKPDKNSKAILPYYQPIDKKFFKERCGTNDEITYNAISHLLASEVVGCIDYDLSID